MVGLFFMICLSGTPGIAGEIAIERSIGEYDLVPFFDFLRDDTKVLTFNDIVRADQEGKFQKNARSSLNFGFATATYWVKVVFRGDANAITSWFLEMTYAPIDLYELYLPAKEGDYIVKKAGDSLPISSWDVFYKNPVFALGQNIPLDKPIYIKIATTGVVNISAVLWRGADLVAHIGNVNFLMGLYYGIIVALSLYNLFLFISFRDMNYFLYVMFMLAYGISQFTYNGYAFQYFWPTAKSWANFSFTFFFSLIFIAMILFSCSFLRLRRVFPKTGRILFLFLWVYGFTMIGNQIIGMRYTSLTILFFSVITISLIYVSAIRSLIGGQRMARFFVLAWTAFLFGMMILLLKMVGIFPHNFFTEYSMQIGSAIEGILLSLSLADRINILKNEKQAVQSKLLEQVQESERLKGSFLEESEKLVEARTRELSIAKDKLEKLARIDALTGLFNRRIFDEIFDLEFNRASRLQRDFSLLLLDVDHFKQYNDRYGHQAGDLCLQSVAGVMLEEVKRVTDTITRYGGEEFAIILAETNHQVAMIIAEKIRSGIERLDIFHGDSFFNRVTVSIGVVSLSPDQLIDQEIFFKKVDQALYQAKNSGRNRVVSGNI